MAFPPLPRHARAVLCPFLRVKFSCTLRWPFKGPRQNSGELSFAAVLYHFRIYRPGQLGFQHDIPHKRLQPNGEIGLFRSWCQCVLWLILRPRSNFPIRPQETLHQAYPTKTVDNDMRATLYGPRVLSELLALGLCVQYGCKRGSGDLTEHLVERV